MSLLLFTDQYSEDYKSLLDLQKSRSKYVLVSAFLDKAHTALREEICLLPRAAQAQLPASDSIVNLYERLRRNSAKSLELESALVCVSQLAAFISIVEGSSEGYLSSETVVVGYGLGQLSAAALSCSHNAHELVNISTEIVRLAFRIGAYIRKSTIGSQIFDVTELPWAVNVEGTLDEVVEKLETLQNELNIPATARSYPAFVAATSCRVTGYPSRISEIAASSLLSTKPVKSGSTTFGLWHASHVYGEGSVAEILEPRFDALSKIRLPHMQQLSPTTGQPLECESAHALVATAVQNILREPIRWDLLQDTLSTYTDRTVLAFGDRSAITELDAPNPDTIEKQVDISTGATQYAGFDDPNGDKIAIVGMSARLPGATDVDMLWDLLVNGRDLHKRVPKDRFPVDTHFDVTGKKQNTSHSPYGCFIENPGMFDARFFHMSPREAAQTDPMHRLALVTAYEALEMSGFVLNSTPSSQSARVGTFYGQTSDDWREVNAAQDISTYFIPGGVRAFAPGRISYHFGFSGPSYSVDTACSSSMAAVQLGCTALRSRECDTVVAGGLNVLTAPDIFAGLSRGQFLSKTGPCQTWDINADGYCRADGVASVILKRYEDALAEKDNILGVILATATNHSADAISITHPHAGNQAQLFESVLHNAGVNPLDISYIEMHGTGTQAGDLAETQSVTSVFAPVGARSPEQTLHIGAIKSNIGHSEAAAGISALVKILLMIQKNIIPPHVGIKTQLNPALPDFNNRNVRIAREAHPWPQNLDKARLMFLNNFSAAGGNTAMLLQEHLPQQVESKADPRSALPILISARTLTSLRKNIQRLTSFLESTPDVSLGSLSYTLSARRMQHSYRVGTVATSISNLKESLAQLEVVGLAPIPSRAPKVAFTYTGQGAFYINCARDLLKQSIVFRDVVNHYNHLAISMGGSSFLPMIDGSAAADQEFPPSAVHVATTCMQMALTRLWESWGLQPALVIGHSLGEYAALNAAGVLSDTDTIFLVMQRAKLLEEKCVAGTHAMLAVNASIAEIEAATHAHGFTYDIACINSAKDVVLASEISTIQKLSDILKKGSYRCATLNLPYAFHSKQLDPVLDEFEHIARGAVFNKPKIPVLSPLYAQVVEENIFSPEYLRNHARKTVDFTGALQQATEDGLIDAKTVFVEIGLHPLCSKMVKSHFDTTVTALPSLQRDRTAWEVLSKTVVSLHCAAVSFDWRQFHRDFETSHQLLQLPSYGFEEKNYWIDYVNDWCLHKLEPRDVVRELPAPPVAAPPKRLSASVHRVMTEDVEDDVITVVTETDLSAPELKNVLMGHQVNDTPLCSSSLYADVALTLGDYVLKQMRPDLDLGVNCGDMEVIKPLIVQGDGALQTLQVSITADFDRNSANVNYSVVDSAGRQLEHHAKCIITFEDKAVWAHDWASTSYLIHSRIDTLKDRLSSGDANQVSRKLAYKLFASLVNYDVKYQGMEEVVFDSTNFEATARVNFQTNDNDHDFLVNPYWIDSVGHISGFIVNGSDATDSKNFVYISHGWSGMRLIRPLQRTSTYTTHVKMQAAPKNIMAGDVYILEGDEVVGVWKGIRFQQIPRKVLNTFLPPKGTAATVAKTLQAPVKSLPTPPKANAVASKAQSSAKPKAAAPASVKAKPAPAAAARPSPVGGYVEAIMEIIAEESSIPRAELVDASEWASLGVDSLLSLQITGRLRETMELDLPSSTFLNQPTVGEFRAFMNTMMGAERSALTSSSSSEPGSSDPGDLDSQSATSVGSVAGDDIPDVKTKTAAVTAVQGGNEVLTKIRDIISEEMNIPAEELVDSADLVSMGADSLMSICILGALREKMDLDLPSKVFQDYPTIEAIGQYLGLNKPAATAKTAKKPATGQQHRATSVFLQGNRSATKKLFLLPDGSGSATSYTHIPALDPSIAVYGLNSPYMTAPSNFTNGIPGIATVYLEELRRRQPQGPYYLGGWSAGGVVAYEIVQQLLAANEEIRGLVLFDSPCPIGLEALPSRLHEFFAEIGLLGDGKNVPDWLIPHFSASIRALSSYEPKPLPKSAKAPKTLAMWAKYGVCRYPGKDPRPERLSDEPKSMTWLLDNRTDFSSNGWDKLLGPDVIKTASVEGNHFDMMRKGEQLKEIADSVRQFLLTV